jgi:hypothetical protein
MRCIGLIHAHIGAQRIHICDKHGWWRLSAGMVLLQNAVTFEVLDDVTDLINIHEHTKV